MKVAREEERHMDASCMEIEMEQTDTESMQNEWKT